MGWYFTITEEMRETGLSGNALIVYAVIHGFSQDGDGCYYGTQARLCEICGVKERALRGILADLVDAGLLLREPVVVDGQARVSYRVPAKNAATGRNCRTPGKNCRSLPPIPPCTPLYPLTPEDNIPPRTTTWCSTPRGAERPQEEHATGKKFQVPTMDEVRDYWAGERLNGAPDEFFDHFSANGWKVGGTAPMKDWKAAARNWSRRETKGRRPAKQETYLDAARRTAERLGMTEHYTSTTHEYDEQ